MIGARGRTFKLLPLLLGVAAAAAGVSQGPINRSHVTRVMARRQLHIRLVTSALRLSLRLPPPGPPPGSALPTLADRPGCLTAWPSQAEMPKQQAASRTYLKAAYCRIIMSILARQGLRCVAHPQSLASSLAHNRGTERDKNT